MEKEIEQSYSAKNGIKLMPKLISIFWMELIKRLNSHNVFVPYANGQDVVELYQKGINVDYNSAHNQVIDFIKKETGRAPMKPGVEKIRYDLILSCLPLGSVYKNRVILPLLEKVCNYDVSNYTVFNFCRSDVRNVNFIDSCEKKGLFVNAIIDMPSGLYAPLSFVDSNIIIFSKLQSQEIFIAKVRDNCDISAVIDNLLHHKSSSKEHHGKWIIKGEFSDYSAYENCCKIIDTSDRMQKCYNGPLLPIHNIYKTLDSFPKAGFNDDSDGAVYIPKIGKSNVVTKISDFTIKGKNYYRLVVNQEQIIPDYLAFALNTEYGIELRLRHMTGETIKSLNRENLLKLLVPVPPKVFQNKILEIDSKLCEISHQSENLRCKLRQMPVAYEKICKDLKNINLQGNKFEKWIEKLPYPLAIILKQYQVVDNNEQRQKKLLFFYEAYSIFVTTILFAAYKKLSKTAKSHLHFDVLRLEKSSFGSWVKLNEVLSKVMRRGLNDAEMMDDIFDCFKTNNRTLINTLCSKDILKLLQEACDQRNSWQGHSGVTSEAQYSDHVRQLKNGLNTFQLTIQDTYEKIQLIRPVKLRKIDGEFINKVEILTGSNPIFEKKDISGVALDENKLYIRMIATDGVFEIPPFLIVNGCQQDKNACYFYNRVESGKTRYISYHYMEKSEHYENGTVAYDALKAVLGSDES